MGRAGAGVLCIAEQQEAVSVGEVQAGCRVGGERENGLNCSGEKVTGIWLGKERF